MFSHRFDQNQRPQKTVPREKRISLRWLKYAFAAVSLVLLTACAVLFFPSAPSVDEVPPSNDVGKSDASSDVSCESTEGGGVSTEIYQPPYLDEGSEISVTEVVALPRIYELFERVPQRSWLDVEVADWGIANHTDIYKKILDYMEAQGIIDRSLPSYAGDYYNAEYPRLSMETVRECVDAAIGPFYRQYNQEHWYPAEGMPQDIPGSIRDEETLLLIEPETGCYVVMNTPMYRHPDSSGDHFYARFVDMERKDGDLIVTVRFANYDVEKGQYSVYAEGGGWWEGDKYHQVLLRGHHPSNYKSDPNSVYCLLHAGTFDEYLPLYQVTFRADGEGEYWWYTSQKIQEGTPIPEEALSAALPEEASLGMKLPVCGEKDSESPKMPELSYFQNGYLWLTLNNRFYRYGPVPGTEETLTPARKVYSFTQSEEKGEVAYEVYICDEYPDGFGLVLKNVSEGTVKNYYRFD